MKRTFFLICLLFSFGAMAQTKAPESKAIDARLLRQDFDSLYLQLQLNHSKLYANRSKEATDEHFKQISERLIRPMDKIAFFREISPFVSGFKDGHTSVNVDFEDPELEQYAQSGGTFFPLEVVIIDNKLYCKSNPFAVGTINRGDEILSINQEPVSSLLPSLKNLDSADGEPFANASLQRLFGFYLWLHGLREPVSTIEFKKAEKVQLEPLKGISKNDLLNLIFKGITPARKLHLYPESSLAVLEFNTYGELTKAYAFIDSCFQIIKNSGLQNVALDLRKNGGGNSAIGDYFLAHLTRKPYSTISSKTWRLGPLAQQFDSTHWVGRAIASAKMNYRKEGEFLHSSFLEPDPPVAIKDSSLFSPVRLFLFTSARTYSSAHMTAMAVKCSGLGTIIGQPTGERLDLTGETLLYRLPNSKLAVYIPVASYKAACGNGDVVGVQPDFTVSYTVEDLRQDRDPELAFLKDLIKRNN